MGDITGCQNFMNSQSSVFHMEYCLPICRQAKKVNNMFSKVGSSQSYQGCLGIFLINPRLSEIQVPESED